MERMKSPVYKKNETESSLTTFANTGLRTLAVASREIPVEEYKSWAKKY